MRPKQDERPMKGAWSPGTYENHCLVCQEQFMGDKRALECADCAYQAPCMCSSCGVPHNPRKKESDRAMSDAGELTMDRIVAGVRQAILDEIVREELEALEIPVIDGATTRAHVAHCTICQLRLAWSAQAAWRKQVRKRRD